MTSTPMVKGVIKGSEHIAIATDLLAGIYVLLPGSESNVLLHLETRFVVLEIVP